jgi:hypothetical protein
LPPLRAECRGTLLSRGRTGARACPQPKSLEDPAPARAPRRGRACRGSGVPGAWEPGVRRRRVWWRPPGPVQLCEEIVELGLAADAGRQAAIGRDDEGGGGGQGAERGAERVGVDRPPAHAGRGGQRRPAPADLARGHRVLRRHQQQPGVAQAVEAPVQERQVDVAVPAAGVVEHQHQARLPGRRPQAELAPSQPVGQGRHGVSDGRGRRPRRLHQEPGAECNYHQQSRARRRASLSHELSLRGWGGLHGYGNRKTRMVDGDCVRCPSGHGSPGAGTAPYARRQDAGTRRGENHLLRGGGTSPALLDYHHEANAGASDVWKGKIAEPNGWVTPANQICPGRSIRRKAAWS